MSKESPFKEVIGKSFELDRDTYIIRKVSDFYKEPSELVELDGLRMIYKENMPLNLFLKEQY